MKLTCWFDPASSTGMNPNKVEPLIIVPTLQRGNDTISGTLAIVESACDEYDWRDEEPASPLEYSGLSPAL